MRSQTDTTRPTLSPISFYPAPRASGVAENSFLRRSWPMAAALFISLSTEVFAQQQPPGAGVAQELGASEEINVGAARSASPQLRSSAEAEKSLRIDPSRRFEFADHIAHGIAMRNRTAGTIHLRGAPVPSRVLAALLYVNFSDGSRDGRRNLPVLFNANRVMANKTGDHDDPCWGMAGNHSYVADVTQFVPIGGNLNQDYRVVLQFDDETSTTGQNPWGPLEVQKVRAQGATLVVVYRTQNTTGSLFVYDALNNSMFSGPAQFDLLHPNLDGNGRFTMAGADGQRGSGHDNSLSNELTFFDGNQIAGPPVASSDWDGSDGWPLPQLWDTHTHNVRLGGSVSMVRYQASGDCLVPVAFVIDAD
jgi:hypothetical protein